MQTFKTRALLKKNYLHLFSCVVYSNDYSKEFCEMKCSSCIVRKVFYVMSFYVFKYAFLITLFFFLIGYSEVFLL